MNWEYLRGIPLIYQIVIIALIVLGTLYSIILHEIAHGYAALLGGDPTAKESGRLSFNPIKHIDPIGTLAVPGVLILLNSLLGMHLPVFGWAKPVPVNPMNLRSRRDMTMVSLAGIITNFAIMLFMLLIILIIVRFIPGAAFLVYAFIMIGAINIILIVFNILPLPPLDGYNFMISVLPGKQAVWLEKNKNILFGVLFALIFFGLMQYIYTPVFWLYEQVVNIIIRG
jgi:Zn-dependent protease